MVTITLDDKDALALLTMVNHIKTLCASEAAEQMTRVAETLRCALLLCDCDGPKTTWHRPSAPQAPAP